MTADELPEGWEASSLGSLITVAYGKALKAEIRLPGTYQVFGSGGVVGEHSEPLTNGETIVIGRKGSVGSVFHCLTPCWPIDTTYYVTDFGVFESSFLLGERQEVAYPIEVSETSSA